MPLRTGEATGINPDDQKGSDQTAGTLPLTEGVFLDATPFLSRLYHPKTFELHEVNFGNKQEDGTGRIHVGRSGNTTYYAKRHGLLLLPGITAIEGSLQTASLVAARGRDGIPVWTGAKFEQTQAAAPEKFVDFKAVVEENEGSLHASVDILTENGELIAQTTGIVGKIETPEDKNPKAKRQSPYLLLPDGFFYAHDLLVPIYDSRIAVIQGIRLDDGITGTGVVLLGHADNTKYYASNHRSDQLPEIKLVHAAMQTSTLIVTQGSEPGSLIPLYTGGSFHPVSDSPMGNFAQIVTKAENVGRGNIKASADILNAQGKQVAKITDITGKLAKPSVVKRMLEAAKRTS